MKYIKKITTSALSLILFACGGEDKLGKIPTEAEIFEHVDTIYCSAWLDYLNSGDEFDKIKSLSLIQKAEKFNSSVDSSYRTDVISDRNTYLEKLRIDGVDKDTVTGLYDSYKCDLKI